MLSCQQMADRLEWAAVRARNELDVPTEELMQVVKHEAKRVIGTYEYGWKQLAPATQADRVAKGFPANEPLLRTGDLRESIGCSAEPTIYGATGVVGSTEEVAVWQEIGTARIPPRSFLGGAMMRCAPQSLAIFGRFAMKLLGHHRD